MWKFITLAAFSIIWSIVASEYDETDMYSKTSGGCGSTLNKKLGGFHIDHNNATECVWTINTTNSTISLYFYYLFMHDLDTITLYPSEGDYESKKNQIGAPITARNGSVTIITGVSSLFMAFQGNTTSFLRHVEGYFTNEHMAAIPPEVEIIYSPIYAGNVSVATDIIYNFNKIQHKRATQVFTFEQFNMSKSTVTIESGGTFIGTYTHKPPTDFFLENKQQILSMKVKQAVNSNDYFMLKIAEVDSSCSGVKIIDNNFPLPLISPEEVLNNGTIVTECRWLVQHKDTSKILGLQFHKLDFHSVFDIAAVNNGQSEISTPILQVTTSNKNISQNHMIRSGSSSMWISFKPVSYTSSFIANVTVHGQGGYFKNSQSFKMEPGAGDDTAFLLEVDENETVYLTFDECVLSPPATLSIYDGFDTNKLLASLRGPVQFPILSGSSKLMIVATNASTSHFRAKFQGISPGCDHMSSLSTENYILSELFNSTCSWIIPPQNKLNSELLVYLQFISLQEGDLLEIHRLDANLTKIASIGANVSHVPHIVVEANVGALIKVTQVSHAVKTDKVVLIGHSSYIPDCSYTTSPKPAEKFQISSPLYPDTYPLFTHCQWNISAPKENFVHLAFDKLKLAQNHCVRILDNSSKIKYEYNSKTPLPDDLFITGDYLIQFDSSNCDKKEVSQSLNADVGFLINATVADCGTTLTKKTGEFNTNITGSESVCIWKVDVSDSTSVNVIAYTITHKNDFKNYDLAVYDGSSVRDAKIENVTNIDVWSRSSNLIFVYRRLNISQPSGVLAFKYSTISCNKTMLCENQICMHPDWKCDGKNDCGDYSDEKNCDSKPVPPPEVKFTGYSATAFWLCVFAMILIGIIVGLGIPVCYQKYKDSRYTRFRELSGIDG